MNHTDFRNWAVKQHVDTNHMYDGLPYKLHLTMVTNEVEKALVNAPIHAVIKDEIISAAWGHDLIEDTRVTYNDVLDKSTTYVAGIIYALTNEKGKNRKERANDKYYEGIRDMPYATLVKVCDRISNVKYSKLMGSRMFEMYQKEHEHFYKSLYHPDYENVFTILGNETFNL
jgi:(p)ppGpp synthase/HD superfamily hydrolase